MLTNSIKFYSRIYNNKLANVDNKAKSHSFLGECDFDYSNNDKENDYEKRLEKITSIIKDEGCFDQRIIESIKKENSNNTLKLLEVMLDDKTFPRNKILPIYFNATDKDVEDKINIINYIQERKNDFGDDYKYALDGIIHASSYNIDFFKSMLSDKDFPKDQITDILTYTYESNIGTKISTYNFIKSNKNLFKEDYQDAIMSLKYVYPASENLTKKLLSDECFPKNKIEDVVSSCDELTVKAKEKFYDFVQENKDALGEDYYSVIRNIRYIYGRNLNLAKTLLFDKDFIKSEAEDTLREYCYSDDNVSKMMRNYEYIKKYKDDSYGYKRLLTRFTQRCNDFDFENAKKTIETIERHKEKFGADYKYDASGFILVDRHELLQKYINDERLNSNETIRELIGVIANNYDKTPFVFMAQMDQKGSLLTPIDMLNYLLRDDVNFNLDEIKKYKKLGYNIHFEKLQNKDNELELVFEKTSYPSASDIKKHKSPCCSEIKNVIRMNKNGESVKSRCEIFNLPNEERIERTFVSGGNYSCDSYYKSSILKKEIRVINDDYNHIYIQKTEASPFIKGVFEITLYDLGKIDEETNVLDGIKKGEIKGREISKTIINKDGLTIHNDNFKYEGYLTQRSYITNKDENKTSLNYRIINPDGEKILDIKRKFELTGNKSTTTINGKKYIAEFDDEEMTAKVRENGRLLCDFNLNKKTKNESQYHKELLWNLIKFSPADVILNLDNIPSIELKSHEGGSWSSCYGEICTTDNLGILAHELGHYKDTTKNGLYSVKEFMNTGKKAKYEISTNEELIKTYSKEIEQLKKSLSEAEMDNIKYFSQQGGSRGTGLNELLAEVNTLTTTYCSKNYGCRELYLMKYFPKTIALAANLLWYN